jgi:FAD/FMN-containing dehydrogenase
MKRRNLLKAALAMPFMAPLVSGGLLVAGPSAAVGSPSRSRVRPGDAGWPSAAQWGALKDAVGGRLLQPISPFAGCASAPDNPACRDAMQQIANPYYIRDQPALTQTSGWVDAWLSQPSAYAVAAQSTADVVAAVNFARKHHLRLVVKGGGHSYQGTSEALDSLLVWMRHMTDVTLHDDFVARGGEHKESPQAAVTVEAGALWIDAYDAVTTRGGRYVQGGGCTTVGVAGLVQSGGFGNFSKQFGTAAAGLIEAEIVTADGRVRIANTHQNADLFWGIKGGGGGSLGVVTRLTLRTHDLPETFGAVFGAVKASTDDAYRLLLAKAIGFYQEHLFNPHWGEQMVFTRDNGLRLSMVFQGLSQAGAEALWAPFIDWVNARKEYTITRAIKALALPAQHFWDAEFFRQHAPALIVADGRPGAPRDHVLWAGDQGQVGWFIHGYDSAWIPASLLEASAQARLVDAMFTATRHSEFALHFNKGLAGAPADVLAAARDTATHPDVVGAFALAICGADGPPAYTGLPGPGPDLVAARQAAAAVGSAMVALRKVAPDAGSYVSESNYFEPRWQRAFWGPNYPRLAAVKHRVDPSGLFFVHHGVGSEAWSADGFTPLV